MLEKQIGNTPSIELDGIEKKKNLIATYNSSQNPSPTMVEEERTLLKNLAAGNREVFWKLWKKHESHLFRCCLWWLEHNHEEAEDILHQALLKAYERLPSNAAKIYNLKAWLTRLTQNVFLDAYRKKRRENSRFIHMEDGAEENAVDPSVEGGSSEELFIRKELYDVLVKAINGLNKRLYEVAVLYFIDEYPYGDIAYHLNITKENARKRIQQARKIIRENIQSYLKNGSGQYPQEVKKRATVKAKGKRGAPSPREKRELVTEAVTLSLVQVITDSGIELSLPVWLKKRTLKAEEKIGLLKNYFKEGGRSNRKRLELADLLYSLGEWSEASEIYIQLTEEKVPQKIEIFIKVIAMLFLLRKESLAASLIQKALGQTENQATQYFLHGISAAGRGHFHAATRSLSKSTAIDPGNSTSWSALGLNLLRTGEFSHSLKCFDKALFLFPDDIEAKVYRWENLCLMGRVNEVYPLLEETIKKDRKNVLAIIRFVHLRCLRGYVEGKEGQKTSLLINRAIGLSPSAPETQNALALYHLYRGEWKKGRDVLGSFAHAHPYSPQAWFLYSQYLFKTGDPLSASRAMINVYALDDKSFSLNPFLTPEGKESQF